MLPEKVQWKAEGINTYLQGATPFKKKYLSQISRGTEFSPGHYQSQKMT